MTNMVKLNPKEDVKRHDFVEKIEMVYGRLPDKPKHLYSKTEKSNINFARGRASLNEEILIIELENRTLTLPYTSVIPSGGGKYPAIITLEYEKAVPNKYLPAEEIVDRGYAIFSIHIDDVTKQEKSFKTGISPYIHSSRRKKSSPGKIALWAWAAIRMAEHMSSHDNVDSERIIISGHGLMARAAMTAAVYYDATSYVIANNPSASPTPYCKENPKSGLTVCDFSHLYSPAFAEERDTNELELLFSALTEKVLLVGSAEESDYFCEYKTLINTHKIDEKTPLDSQKASKSKIPTLPYFVRTNNLSYHIRSGTEYFSREDWNIYLDYIDSKDR